MNRRYIDFVPTKDSKNSTTRSIAKPITAKPVAKAATKPVVQPAVKPAVKPKVEKKKPQAPPRIVYTAMPAMKQRTTKAKDAPKMSFSTKNTKPKSEPMLGVVEDVNHAAAGARVTENTYNVPNSPFINRVAVAKRPLSKNVYQKKTEKAVTEKPKGPVTIIAKPEKDAHVSVVVTIILTIILGAAAGTVAFLLLPK